MGTFQSPADPLFWSHHAYVDLLLTIYFKCRVGFGKLTDTQKMNNPYAFVQCPHREDAGFFTSSSTITMRNGEFGVNPMQVSEPGQVLYPFFKDLPNKYYQLSDVTTLGDASRYMYQVGGLVGQMAMQCDASKSAGRLLHEESVGPIHNGCEVEVDEQSTVPNEVRSAPAPLVGQSPVFQVVSAVAQDKDASKVDAWTQAVQEQLRALNHTAQPNHTEEISQMEKMVCMFYDKCRGGVKDYSEAFKKAFQITEPPPCKRIVDDLNKNTSKHRIKLAKWKEMMEHYFPCDVPTSPSEPIVNNLPPVSNPSSEPTPYTSSPLYTSSPEPTVNASLPASVNTTSPAPSTPTPQPQPNIDTPEPSVPSATTPSV